MGRRLLIGAVILFIAIAFASKLSIGQRANAVMITLARSHPHSYHQLAPSLAKEKGFFEGISVNILPDELKKDTPNGEELRLDMQTRGIDIVVDARTRVIFSHDPAKGRFYAL